MDPDSFHFSAYVDRWQEAVDDASTELDPAFGAIRLPLVELTLWLAETPEHRRNDLGARQALANARDCLRLNRAQRELLDQFVERLPELIEDHAALPDFLAEALEWADHVILDSDFFEAAAACAYEDVDGTDAAVDALKDHLRELRLDVVRAVPPAGAL